jgi:glycosyltransferase involved in cell wall biosynthesis
MATVPAISIITPTLNRREALSRAIASVRGQTFVDYEHIIVDDGSSDGTAEFVGTMADPRLRFARHERRMGANAARNRGLRMAQSDLVTFLDSDDEFLPSRLERSVNLFSVQPGVDLVISSFQTSKGGGAPTPTVNRGARFDPDMLERAIVAQITAIAGSAITARKAAIERVGGFDEDLWRLQDRDLLLRFAEAGYGATVLEAIDWTKHHSVDSISRQRGGYVAAYGELLGRHPQVRERYPDIAAYMVARKMLNSLLQGRVPEAASDYQANRKSEHLGFPPASLVGGYAAGRRRRRQIAGEVNSLPGSGMAADGMLPSPALARP